MHRFKVGSIQNANLYIRFAVLILVLVASLLLNLCLGDVPVSLNEVWTTMFSPSFSSVDNAGLKEMLWQIRLPRLLTALVVGIALSISGYVLQVLSRNYLADPYLTGVSSGAALAASLVMMFNWNFSLLPLAALAGGLIASLTVASLARTAAGLSIARLLLAGVAVSAISNALITLLLTNAESIGRSQGLIFWLAGGIGGNGWDELLPTSIYVLFGVVGAFLLTKPMRLLALGTHSASALGLDVPRTQWLLLLLAVLLCGASVAISGLVGFVGLIAPQIARRLFGRDERGHLISAALTGGVLVLLSDLAARTLGQGQELPLGTLLSLIGGPFFLLLVVRHRSEGL